MILLVDDDSAMLQRMDFRINHYKEESRKDRKTRCCKITHLTHQEQMMSQNTKRTPAKW